MSVATIAAMTARRAKPISKSGQLRLIQSMLPILRLRRGKWSYLQLEVLLTQLEAPPRASRSFKRTRFTSRSL